MMDELIYIQPKYHSLKVRYERLVNLIWLARHSNRPNKEGILNWLILNAHVVRDELGE